MRAKRQPPPPRYVVCVRNRGFAGSLERRKVYRVVPDARAERRGLLHVIDESGEGYLYPERCFVVLDLSDAAARAIAAAS